MTLITTNTGSGVATSDFTSGIDSTYKLYIFKFYNVNPATDNPYFYMQFNAVGASGFDETITSSFFRADHAENDSFSVLAYDSSIDMIGASTPIPLGDNLGSDADQHTAGELYLFNPSNTTYAKHFYSRNVWTHGDNRIKDNFVAGYIDTTSAIDEVQFKMSTGNFDAVIKMYGVK